MLRSVYEGVAIAQSAGLADLTPDVRVDDVRLGGGGARSSVWSDVFAAAVGNTLLVPAGEETGARGWPSAVPSRPTFTGPRARSRPDGLGGAAPQTGSGRRGRLQRPARNLRERTLGDTADLETFNGPARGPHTND